jgi:hypothetical protein
MPPIIKATPFAYNTGGPIAGTEQFGDLAVGFPSDGFGATGLTWWNGPDENLGYIIGESVPDNSQPTPIPNVTASVGFYRSDEKTEVSFLSLVNQKFSQSFVNGVDAKEWLNTNGYWTSFSTISNVTEGLVLNLNAKTYAGYGPWIDSIGSKEFNFYNSPSYTGTGEKYFTFNSSSGQYAQCNTSLPSLPVFTVEVWHRWSGINTSDTPCLISEIFANGAINYVIGSIGGFAGGYFSGGFQQSPPFSLTPGDWYQIVLTVDSSQMLKIYLNNTLISTAQTGGSLPSSSGGGIRLMRRWDLDDYWGGDLGIVRIYNTDLGISEIDINWTADKSRFGL